MRHFFARPVATRPCGMGEPAPAAALVTPSGRTLRVAPGVPRAVASTIDLAAVAAAADHGLGSATRAQEQPRWQGVVILRPADARWTNATIAGIIALHACPARCGARRRGETAKLGSAPCLPSIRPSTYPAIRPASARDHLAGRRQTR